MITQNKALRAKKEGRKGSNVEFKHFRPGYLISTFDPIASLNEGQVFLTYDLNGNLLTRISDTAVTTCEWDGTTT